jgi:hypothetical protein
MHLMRLPLRPYGKRKSTKHPDECWMRLCVCWLVHHHHICLLLHYEHQHAPSDRKSIECETLCIQQKEKLELPPRRSSTQHQQRDVCCSSRAKNTKIT